MKNNHFKTAIGLILTIFIVVAGFLVNLYIIGEPVDGYQCKCGGHGSIHLAFA